MSRPSPHRRRRSGIVLIVTLLMLAVISLVLIALFSGASHQIFGSASAATTAREKMLADSSIALVIGQIEQASSQTNVAWISQPGLLRVYGAGTSRVPLACYKLYSTASMTNLDDSSGNLNFFTNDVPANWTNQPSQYTDLNSPVQTPGLFGRAIYPILDPSALTNQVTGVSSDNATVAMPVAWLYELQDGTLGPETNATASNPIVARIAFWTDDDTCRIDVNTAGTGSPWSTPRVNSTNDTAWCSNQPVAGEFSTYPGHPAATSLTAAFGTNVYSPQQLLGFTPRYAWGGSQFNTQSTTPGEMVPPKMDRLYATVDEICFSTNFDSYGERLTNSITPGQIETARFVLTAHSVAPETTIIGEPRVAIWPIADSTSTSAPRITVADAAITNAATIGAGTTNMRCYYFQRGDPRNTKDDFDPAGTNAASASNVQLFNDLVARGTLSPPGYSSTLAAKYPGAQWTQVLLEIADFIRTVNAVDPSPAPFVPFAGGDSTGAGRAFVVPLTMTYGSGSSALTLRALGRCPTLSSLTLVFYVSGFTYKNGAYVDYEETPDDATGSNWKANFLPSSSNWTNVVGERVRAFAIPCTDQPGCGYPEVSDACTIQIKGLDAMKVSLVTTNGDFGFANTMTSHLLSDTQKSSPQDRAWGGNEGPLAGRAAAIDAQGSGTFTNTFAGTKAFPVQLTNSPIYKAATSTLTWTVPKTNIVLNGNLGLTVLLQDARGNTLQTFAPTLTNTSFPIPTPVAEYSYDGSGSAVMPSYYMTVKNRMLLTGANREFLIQPGDVSRGIEAGTDLRVMAGMTNVPAGFFKAHPSYLVTAAVNAHNLHFADGTAVYGASGTNTLFASAFHLPATTNVTWTDWTRNATTNYAWPITAPNSSPSVASASSVTMLPVQNIGGDWDTGPGLSPDGAEINLPDAGTTNTSYAAYFSMTTGAPGAPTQRTPNALVPSPVIFGSLPAGINPASPASSEPWRTLLFCPYPASYPNHPGAVSPPDYLILDNFWMPVVEPYPISTCMATAGKINLNDQIAPFTYLHRNTALHALLGDLRIPAIPVSSASTYKSSGAPSSTVFWNPVDENATIAQIENKFATNSVDAYLSESEICTVPLVPSVNPPLTGSSVAAMQTALASFWNGAVARGGLTGDNLRELPYALLYGRLTTRSNSYTVYVRVQVLKKLPSDPHQNVWNDGVDVVLGEWRGAYEIERYLDPAAAAPPAGSPLGPYKYRILSSRRFAP